MSHKKLLYALSYLIRGKVIIGVILKGDNKKLNTYEGCNRENKNNN